jgi:hypothetical protein
VENSARDLAETSFWGINNATIGVICGKLDNICGKLYNILKNKAKEIHSLWKTLWKTP